MQKPISLLLFFIVVLATSCNHSVSIGNQTWASKNLDVTTYQNGETIPQVTDPKEWAKITYGAWCYYNNNPINGKLYNWYAVNDPRKLAPAGWHIPSDAEWTTLGNNLGGLAIAGGPLKDNSKFYWHDPNTGATNSSGFQALPGGHRFYDGTFYDQGLSGNFWTSTPNSSGGAFCYRMNYNLATLYKGAKFQQEGLSVRCIKD